MPINVTDSALADRESMHYDVVIVGAGPAGLAAAIHIKQLAKSDISVCVLEKGAQVGAHSLSGAVMDPIALTELFPNWQSMGAPVTVAVGEERFLILDKNSAKTFPQSFLPKALQNQGYYLVSLSKLTAWLAEQAENLGVDVFPGFPAAHILYDEKNTVIGVATGDMGIGRDGKPTDAFERGMALFAKYTLFAEGTRGQLGRELIEKFALDKNRDPQSYAIGLKEVWEIDPALHQEGLVIHSTGWPMDDKTYGGSFLYHLDNHQVAVGLTIGLNYRNPYLSPFREFQRFKTHPSIARFLIGGKRIAYGARAITAGGIQALPKLVFQGGALIGCEAGFLNGGRLKGIHAAIKSGMLAAQAIITALSANREHDVLTDYISLFEQSWLHDELQRVRNFKPYMNRGTRKGACLFGIDQILFRGHTPWTLHRDTPDYAYLQLAKESKKIAYSKPDGKLSFDMPSSLYLSGTAHEENQPPHLTFKDARLTIEKNWPRYDGLESRFCPAGVYEFYTDEQGQKQLRLHPSNCLHCKTCDIKEPEQNIIWVAPEGGGGPNYTNM